MKKIWGLFLNLATAILVPLGIATAAPFLASIMAISAITFTGIAIKDFFKPTITNTVSAEFVGTFPADKLFTGYAIVPAVFFSIYDRDKLEDYYIFDRQLKENEEINGYCSRKYQVAFGYEQMQELFTNKAYRQAACENRFDDLPPPVPLSVNTLSSKTGGKFPVAYCTKLDNDSEIWGTGNIPVRVQYIIDALDGQANSLSSILKKGRQALGTFMKIYCPSQL